MKYINGNKVKAEINEIIDGLKRTCNANSLDTTEERIVKAELCVLDLVKDIIDHMMKDEVIPSIDKDSQKKGWLDFGLTMTEISLHRGNAINRIKEHKEHFNLEAVPDSGTLYHVSEYYKAVGVELFCCCLQSYCKDFMFTQDEVKNFIEKED